MEDGPEQQKRDAEMRKAMNGEAAEGNPNQWADRKKNIELMGYDADKAVDEYWTAKGEKEIASVA